MEMFRLAKLLKTYFFLKKFFFFILGLIFFGWKLCSPHQCFVNIEDVKVTLIIVQFTFPHFSIFFRMKLL